MSLSLSVSGAYLFEDRCGETSSPRAAPDQIEGVFGCPGGRGSEVLPAKSSQWLVLVPVILFSAGVLLGISLLGGGGVRRVLVRSVVCLLSAAWGVTAVSRVTCSVWCARWLSVVARCVSDSAAVLSVFALVLCEIFVALIFLFSKISPIFFFSEIKW